MDYVIAVDLGGTQLRAALVAADGRVVAHERTPTLVQEGPLAVVGRMLTLIARVRLLLPAGGRLLGVGIGAPGPLDPETGIVYSPPNLPGWEAFPLRQMVADALGLPVALGNDANAAALAEWRFGGGQGRQHIVYITVSTGIGGGGLGGGRPLLGRLGPGPPLGFPLPGP
ncbi:MAG TPA: ROK family protein, partial [Chloroflexaceae bacterium]|nr:ROK family protein [Chloroflexaceae bacterium]